MNNYIKINNPFSLWHDETGIVLGVVGDDFYMVKLVNNINVIVPYTCIKDI